MDRTNSLYKYSVFLSTHGFQSVTQADIFYTRFAKHVLSLKDPQTARKIMEQVSPEGRVLEQFTKLEDAIKLLESSN